MKNEGIFPELAREGSLCGHGHYHLYRTPTKLSIFKHNLKLKSTREGFPGGSVVKNLRVSAGDMGSIPDLGRSHRLWATTVDRAQESRQLSERAPTTETRAA